jgi:hypothetical protein
LVAVVLAQLVRAALDQIAFLVLLQRLLVVRQAHLLVVTVLLAALVQVHLVVVP